MGTRREIKTLCLVIACALSPACATKKYVKQEVTTTRSELSTRIDQEANRRSNLESQLQELSQLNKANSTRIDQVQTNVDTAVRSIEPKIEDAKKTGTEAHGIADTALGSAKENAAAFANRNNYKVLDSKEVLFKSGSAALDSASKATLDEIVRAVSANKNLLVELKGYTDSIGGPGVNLRLSNRRVDEVTRYLVESQKVDLFRIYSLGLGAADPADSNKTSPGRAKNRRVTIRLLGTQ